MTFATAKDESASDRFILARVTPGRSIVDTLSSIGGGLYEVSWTIPVDRLERNGTELTSVSSTPGSNDEYYWDGSTLTVKLASAPDADSNVLILFYHLFYTSHRTRIAPETPDNASTTDRIWEPRIIEEPAFNQSVKNNLFGVLSTSFTNLTISNQDSDFQQYLSDDDSLNDKDVKIWQCINDISNIQKVFVGKIKSVRLFQRAVSFTLYDLLTKLDQPATMGDGEQAYYDENSSLITSLEKTDRGEPIPYIFGPESRFDYDTIEEPLFAGNSGGQNAVFNEGAGDLTRSISAWNGMDGLASSVQAALNNATTYTYTCTWDSLSRKFTITTTAPASTFIWKGASPSNTINDYIGFETDLTFDTSSKTGTSRPGPNKLLSTEKLNRAVCIDYTSDQNNSTSFTRNRNWGICRVSSSGHRQIVFSTVGGNPVNAVSVITVANNRYYYYVDFNTGNDIRIGDIFSWKLNGGDSDHFLLCVEDQPTTVDGTSYSHLFRDLDAVGGSPLAIAGAGTEIWTQHTSPTVIVESKLDGDLFYLTPDDMTTSETTTIGGNKFINIQMADNLELTAFADVLGFRTWQASFNDWLSPDNYNVYYKAGSKQLGHAECLKAICDASGMDTNAASFTTAESALSANLAFQIPTFDQTDFNTYRDYAQRILKSTLGILFLNNSFELEYLLLSTPSSTDITDDSIYLRDSLNVDISYKDIVTQLIGYNPHAPSGGVASNTVTNNEARYLHEIINVNRFRHVLADITNNSRLTDIMNLLSKRIVVYAFREATDKLNAELGDDFQLDSSEILGALTSKDLKILTIDKSSNNIFIEASDLGDL